MKSASTGSPVGLVDTNVLAYAYDPAEPAKQRRAIDVLDRLGDARGALSVQILGEYFVTVTRKLRPPVPPDIALRSVERYLSSWHVLPLTPAIAGEAARGAVRFQLHYYDALVWATAKLNQIPLVLSEDFNVGGVLEGVRFVNPFATTFDLSQL